MTHILVVYDRVSGRLVREAEFARRTDALHERFVVERAYQGQPNVEVVVLSARTRADIQRTHARYFESLDELAARMG
jgi:hypothetical protein